MRDSALPSSALPSLSGATGAPDSTRYYVLEHHPENGTALGFWLYLMSDCLVFARSESVV